MYATTTKVRKEDPFYKKNVLINYGDNLNVYSHLAAQLET